MADSFPYLASVGKLGEMLLAIRNAQAPQKFTVRFLEDLGYKSTNDRLFIGLLKALGFLDANGTPTQRYFDYLDETRSKEVLAVGIEQAFDQLFRVNRKAYQMTRGGLKGKLKSLTQGKLSASVIDKMTSTFLELVKHADFSEVEGPTLPPAEEIAEEAEEEGEAGPAGGIPLPRGAHDWRPIDALSYRIEIVLPASRDRAVYDALFRSLKEHLL